MWNNQYARTFENPDTKALGWEKSTLEHWKKQVPTYEPVERCKRGNPSKATKIPNTFEECSENTQWLLEKILKK
jgi:hypothetical protein